VRIFVAGATGAIGIPLVRLLVQAGHTVAGMTRSEAKAGRLRELGAEPVVCDVYDLDALRLAVAASRPDAVVDQLTDLPDTLGALDEYAARNDRMRTEGTRNLIEAATAANAERFVAQSIAWRPPAERGAVIDRHEQQVLAIGGVVARYGRLYGPGTFYERSLPDHPRIHVDAAARATPPLLGAPAGVVTIAEPAAPPD
jgi:uncharacterized protein YbjT (DUF2867 family)